MSPAAPSEVPESVRAVLNSPGKPLEPSTRTFMESRFGHDFRHVRVHADEQAARSAREVNARAYTVGWNVAFGARQYRPHTSEGLRLLAHELTHVVQQQGGAAPSVQRKVGHAAEHALVRATMIVGRGLSALREKKARTVDGNGTASGVDSSHEEHLQRALTNLQALRGGSEEQEIWRAVEPILAAAGERPAVVPGLRRWAMDKGPGDALEREADQMAMRVVDGGTAIATPRNVGGPHQLQRQVAEGAILGGALLGGGGTGAGGAVAGGALVSNPVGWAILAGAALVGLGVGIYYLTRDETTTDVTTDTNTETRPTCETAHPGVRLCFSLPAEYTFPSHTAALTAMKAALRDQGLRLHSPSPTTSGPCPGTGTHYNVRQGGSRAGSITCCPCCTNTPQGPAVSTRCRIVW